MPFFLKPEGECSLEFAQRRVLAETTIILGSDTPPFVADTRAAISAFQARLLSEYHILLGGLCSQTYTHP